MKKYMKPAAEAVEMEAQQMLAYSIDIDNQNPAKEGAGDGYSDGLVKGESSFWE